MQRRASAVYAAFFLVVGWGAYGLITVAEQPTVSITEPDVRATPSSTVTAGGQLYNVTDIGDGSAELLVTNESERQTQRTIAEGDIVSIDGTDHVVHFPGNGAMVLSDDVAAYQKQVEAREYFPERINGLWGVIILSGLAAIFLLGAAYLPSRY